MILINSAFIVEMKRNFNKEVFFYEIFLHRLGWKLCVVRVMSTFSCEGYIFTRINLQFLLI